MPSAWLRNGPTHRNCSAPTLLLLRKTRSSLAEGTSRQKPPGAPSALPASRRPTPAHRPSTGTPGRSPPAWGKLRTRNDGAAAALYPLSAPGGGEGWGEVGDSRALADTHLTLPSLRDGPLPLPPERRRGILFVRPLRQERVGPGGEAGVQESLALLCGFERQLRCRAKDNTAAVGGGERSGIAGFGRAICVTQDVRIDTAAAVLDDRGDPTLQCRAVVHGAGLGDGFEPVRIAECARRKARRQPGEQPVERRAPIFRLGTRLSAVRHAPGRLRHRPRSPDRTAPAPR